MRIPVWSRVFMLLASKPLLYRENLLSREGLRLLKNITYLTLAVVI